MNTRFRACGALALSSPSACPWAVESPAWGSSLHRWLSEAWIEEGWCSVIRDTGEAVPLQTSQQTAKATIYSALICLDLSLRWCPSLISAGDSEDRLEAMVEANTYIEKAWSTQLFLLPLSACAVFGWKLAFFSLQINMQLYSCDRWPRRQWGYCPACTLLGWILVRHFLEGSVWVSSVKVGVSHFKIDALVKIPACTCAW